MEEEHISKIYINELLAKFELNNIVYDIDAYSDFKNFSDETLKKWLLNLEDVIKSNFEKKIYTKNVKENLYKILSIYRERFIDINILDKINELIIILNKSSDINAYGMLADEFDIRYLGIISFDLECESKFFKIEELEEYVIDSICSDYKFLKSLIDNDKASFLDNAICNSNYLISLNYLINLYGYVLKDDILFDKLIDLLKCNIETSKDLRKRKLENDGNLEDVYHESKVCLRKLKKLQKDRL